MKLRRLSKRQEKRASSCIDVGRIERAEHNGGRSMLKRELLGVAVPFLLAAWIETRSSRGCASLMPSIHSCRARFWGRLSSDVTTQGELMRRFLVAVTIILVSACSSVRTNPNGWIEPLEAVRMANEDPAYGIRGEFVVTVKALDSYPERSFLNSELDYRDQRNLTIRMPTSMLPKLEERLGVKFHDLKGRRLVVTGVAKRARIDFVTDNKPTGKYYYQTHVSVDSATQIRFAQ
jgi:hypothetical protein